MSFSRWAPIEPMIREFQGFLAPTVPQLKIEQGVDCAHSYPKHKAIPPALKERGVYLIFDDSEALVYIGMAGPDRSLIQRIRAHRKSDRFVPRWIDVITFDYSWKFFAPSLELYLIDNVAGIEGNKLVNQRGARWGLLRRFLEYE